MGKVLKGILKDSKEFYEQEKKSIEKELSKLPNGSIKKRKIGDSYYYYYQYRKEKKIIHDYLGKSEPKELDKKIKKRKALKKELKKVQDSLKLLSKVK